MAWDAPNLLAAFIPPSRLPVQLTQWRDSLRYSAKLRQDAARSDYYYYFSSGVTLT